MEGGTDVRWFVGGVRPGTLSADAPQGESPMPLSPRRPARVVVALFAAVCLWAQALPSVEGSLAASPRLQLPDLRMAKPRDLRLQRVASGSLKGHRLLRFTTILVNEGRGPIDVVGKRTCRSTARCPTMTVRQRIRRTDGTWTVIATAARMRFEVGDHHYHWHVVDFEGYRLWRLGVRNPTPRIAKKFGFCFFDIARVRAFGPATRRYAESRCGTPSSLRVHVGLSEGWQDTYPWDFAGQYIDVTGVPRGEYLLCVTADPKRRFRQSDTTNDEAWVRLRIGSTGIVVRQSRKSSCAAERRRWAPAPTPTPRPTSMPTPTASPAAEG